ncbi:uncharacterized protein LOC110981335 [Acanthaster planci]|uniref:Uncharacterized protein LOC110981335 n=1 Tax=Acanthaster planci TaxID=133434 RepID=A0A8B7YQ07_ACAPL|nr:uncharacterized protein LOC110981335 [Acanthaster planci]
MCMAPRWSAIEVKTNGKKAERSEFSKLRNHRFAMEWKLALCCLLMTITKSDATNDLPVTNVGRIFSFLVPGNGVSQGDGPLLSITAPTTSEEVPTHVRVVVPRAEFSTSVSITPGTTGAVQLPPTAVGRDTGPQQGTVRLEANSPVTIQVMVHVHTGSSSSEAFLALPLESLGMEYIASSTTTSIQLNANDQSRAMLTITGVCDGTSVSIKAAQPVTYQGVVYKMRRTLRVMLDNGESVQIEATGQITGTRITSDKPIAVLLATTCPAEADDEHCFYSVEQLSPVYALGKQFLVAQLVTGRDSDVVDEVLVLGTRAGTTVEIPGHGMSRRLGRGEQWRLPTVHTDAPLFLEADRPVQVTLYSTALDGIGCSPQQQSCNSRFKTMTVVPPLEQFTNRADFTAWSTEEITSGAVKAEFQNFVTILANFACDDLAPGLVSTSGSSANTTWVKEAVPNKVGTCVLRTEVQPGTLRIDAELLGSSEVQFAVLLYGATDLLAYSLPVTTGGNHLRYISREIERHECTMESYDPCKENPCQHSGNCITDGNGYRCSCISPYYEGTHCETEVDLCSLEVPLCFNGGTCTKDQGCLCPLGWAGRYCERDINSKAASSTGREFVFTFMEHSTPRRSPSILVSTSGNSNTFVNVSIPVGGFMETFSIPPNQVKMIELPTEALSIGSRRQYSGVLVNASQDINLIGFHNSITPGDGFLALPVHALGTQHYVIAARQRKKRPAEKSQLAIVAANDDTNVYIRIHVPVTFEGRLYAAYSSIITNLQRLEVAQLQSQYDLTKAEVSSDGPVAVLSGSTCGYTMYEQTDRKSCSFMVEQLPPTQSWGKRFLVSPFLGNTNGETTIRIIGGPKQTIFTAGRTHPGYLYDGSMEERYITQPTYIIATKPVLVVAFSVQATSDCSGKTSDCQIVSVPTMSVVPSLNQFTSSAVFTTPSAVNTYSIRYKNYVSIISSDCSDIRLSQPSEVTGEKTNWDTIVNIPTTDLCMVGKEIDPGQYRVGAESGEVIFSSKLYGFNNYGSAYGFPLALGGHSAEGFVKLSSGTAGKEFILTFISGGNYWPTEGPRLLITGSTQAAKTEVTVTGTGLERALTLGPYETQVVDIPPTLIAVNGHEPYPDTAIHVRSSHDIMVYGMNDAYGTDEGYGTLSDGFQALPVSVLGREYFVVTSWPTYQHYPTRFMQYVIIGIHDGTRVDINLRAAVWFDGVVVYGGAMKTITLNRLQVAYFKSYNDHTGTHVISTKPVAVISGTDCGFAPRYSNDGPLDYPCDHQVEFLTPAERWGHTFLLATLQGYKGGDIFVKTQGLHPYSSVKLGSGGNTQMFNTPFTFNVGHRGYVNQTVARSSMPLSVSAFTIYQPLLNCINENGSCHGHSRPVLFTIPPVENFQKRVIFPSYRVRGAEDMASYADIYTNCSEADFVLVNGARQRWDYPLEEIGETGYCVLRLQLATDETATSYVVESSLETGKLGVITYGFSTQSGYAFPGGFA